MFRWQLDEHFPPDHRVKMGFARVDHENLAITAGNFGASGDSRQQEAECLKWWLATCRLRIKWVRRITIVNVYPPAA